MSPERVLDAITCMMTRAGQIAIEESQQLEGLYENNTNNPNLVEFRRNVFQNLIRIEALDLPTDVRRRLISDVGNVGLLTLAGTM